MTNNPDARLALRRIEAAQAAITQANAAFWPRLQVQSSYAGTDNPVGVFGSVLNQGQFDLNGFDLNNPPPADNLNVKGLATLPLYAGGRIQAARQTATSAGRASEVESEAVRQQVAQAVAAGFFTVLKAREVIGSTEAAVRSYQTNLWLATNRFRAGTLLRAEVLDVEVRLAQAHEDMVRAHNGLALAERGLMNLIGIEGGEFSIADSAPELPAVAPTETGQRPELAAARHRIEAAEAEVRQARSGFRPRVNAFASYDYDHGWKFNGSGESWTAGALVQWDVWDGRLTRGRVAEAQARLEAAREEARRLRLAIDLETEQARLNLQEALQRVDVTERTVALAAESVELTRARFEQGLALSAQLIDAETALTSARVRRAEAEADRRIAWTALRKALGLPLVPRPTPGVNR